MDFDTIFENYQDLDEEEDLNPIIIRCQYSEIMNENCKDMYPSQKFYGCSHIVKPNSRLCAYHLDCHNCGNPTVNKNSLMCAICKCDCQNCNEIKLDNSNYCKDHSCNNCKQFKNRYWDKLCTDCKCYDIDCKNIKIKNGNCCEIHSCNFCDSYMKIPESNTSNYIKGMICPNDICKCIVNGCTNKLNNKFCCEMHTCKYCEDLYDKSDLKDVFMEQYFRSTAVHIAVKGKRQVIDLINGIMCKNQPVKNCLAESSGYMKSNKCSTVIAANKDDNICSNCQHTNRCFNCRTKIIDIEYLNYKACKDCIYKYECLNCNKKCLEYIDNMQNKLCSECDKIVNACHTCKNIFVIGSIEFPPVNIYPKSFNCAKCISIDKNHYNHYSKETHIKASMISWKLQIDDFNDYIKRIYERKDNKIKIELLYNLVIHLLDEIKTPMTYYKTLKLLSRSKESKDDIIVEYLPTSNDNLIGLFIRCANLPNELFWHILENITIDRFIY